MKIGVCSFCLLPGERAVFNGRWFVDLPKRLKILWHQIHSDNDGHNAAADDVAAAVVHCGSGEDADDDDYDADNSDYNDDAKTVQMLCKLYTVGYRHPICYGVPIMRVFDQTERVITAPHCTSNRHSVSMIGTQVMIAWQELSWQVTIVNL